MGDGYVALAIACGLTQAEAELVWPHYATTLSSAPAMDSFLEACVMARVHPNVPEGWGSRWAYAFPG